MDMLKHLIMNNKPVIVAVMTIFLLLVVITIVLTEGIVNDDTYITLRYSRNLYQQHQFTYNLNNPTYSLTTPLWAIFLACFGWVTQNFVILAQILSTVLSLISVIFLYRLSRQILGTSYALLPVVFFLLDPYLVGATYCGTEMALFSLLGLMFTYRIVSIKFKVSQYILSALLLSLLIMTRPEGVVIFIISSVYLVLFYRREGFKAAFSIGIFTSLMMTPWLFYTHSTFKTIIPTSLILKSVDSTRYLPFSDPITMKNLTVLIIKGYSPHILIIAIGALCILYSSKKNAPGTLNHLNIKKLFTESADNSVQVLPSVMALGLVVFYFAGLKEKAVSSRYLVTISPFLMIMTAQFAKILVSCTENNKRKFITYAAVILFMIMINVGAINSRVKRSDSGDAPRVVTGKWIAENIPETSIIGNFGGAGGIAYYFNGIVWDYDLISTMGKDIEFAKKRRQKIPIETIEYMYKEPDYVVVASQSDSFDDFGDTVYQNSNYKIIKIEQYDQTVPDQHGR